MFILHVPRMISLGTSCMVDLIITAIPDLVGIVTKTEYSVKEEWPVKCERTTVNYLQIPWCINPCIVASTSCLWLRYGAILRLVWL